MVRRNSLRLGVVAASALALTLVGSTAALAQPTNDDFASATVITSLPFTTAQDTSEATSDPSDPVECYNNGSVWYAYTASADTTIDANTFGSNYDTVLSAWTGSQGSLTLLACNDDAGSLQSRISFAASAGTTYYFMVSFCCGHGGTGGGSLQLSVSALVPPGNDSFANATVVGALPFADTQNLAVASVEAGEPQPSCFGTSRTVWYSVTPTTTQSLSASVDQYGAGVAVYTGTSLANLSPVGCTNYYYYPATFRAQAGTTYFIQVGETSSGAANSTTFRLRTAPDPVASFYYYPDDPSAFDTVQLIDASQDPANVGISARLWEFGDGGTSTQQNPTHRFTADGDYTVRLTVTTTDGRTASTSQVVGVRTHDVAIIRLGVPQSARVGQTIAIDVYVRNTRYPETVRVELDKGVPGGFTGVGVLTLSVPVKMGGQSTRFLFSYTVTSDDRALGKITFRATATIVNQPDALPADNQLLSTPIKVM
ncbi:MAG TPA: PKD domain-containing protein [Micromonosporaceae bacterium]|nr:PKD domain-containing protein [Micromonosporaceae bacterium]